MRQLAAFERGKAELEALGCSIIVVSPDSLELTQDVIKRLGLTFTMGYGGTYEDAETIGGWWNKNRYGFFEPSEFLLGRGGTVLGAMYASGPVGRMSVDEVVYSIKGRERRRLEQDQQEKPKA